MQNGALSSVLVQPIFGSY